MRFDQTFTKLTVDWWMLLATLGGDSQYGISSDVAVGFNRTAVNEGGCYFFWDTGTTLSIVTANGAANTTTALVGPPAIATRVNYRLEYSPGVDCKFYLNGVLVGTHTTHLPDALTDIIYWGGGLDDNGTGTDIGWFGPASGSLDF